MSFGAGFTTKKIAVDDATVSVTVGGEGPVVVLLHGYAEDSRMWGPLAAELAPRFTVVVPDLPGIGNSSIPENGIDMVSSAKRIRDTVRALGFSDVIVAGHDIGLMVAYAYAATHRDEVHKLALMDAFLPGIAGWEPIYNDAAAWHFRFYGPTPLALVSGRERLYFEHFWNDFAANPRQSIPEKERVEYAAAYARPGRMAAGFAYFEAFLNTAKEFAVLGSTQLDIPVLAIGGDHANGVALGEQVRAIARDATVVIVKNSGHWLMEEQPAQTMTALVQFLERTP
ncbi:MAG TPA: alpha/beta hydrolase [Candidatus Acidoferrales bacterium]|jgi:pimeloyl-ACP methyl ester carboxylesterase|nr:alpha/beta hydrolase [Candidatus Acidoferrales bacterium]